MDLIRTLIRGGGHDTVEPPRAAPRVAEPASLTRLWRKADGDVADHVVSFLPTKCLAVLPTLADSFRRDQWRMLGVVMRRQNAAAGTRAILSTLQVMGRELSHYREDWQGQADLIPRRWRGCKGGRGAPGDVDIDHKVGISSNTTAPGLIIDRTTPHNSVFIGVVNPDLGVEDRCCMQRFRVSLRYNGNREGTGGSGCNFRVISTRQREVESNAANERVYSSYHVVSLHVDRVATGVNLIWQAGPTNVVLKHAPGPHTFSIDAKLNWSTGTATVTVDGVEFEGTQPCRFIPHPCNQITLNAEHSGRHFFGPIDVWYFQAPPPEPGLMPFAPQRM